MIRLQSNLHPDLRLNISLKSILATNLPLWTFKVKEWDDHMWAKDAHVQKLIDTSVAMQYTTVRKKAFSYDLCLKVQFSPVFIPPRCATGLDHHPE